MVSAATNKDEAKRPASYRTIWRWHFYAGLLVAPVLLVLAVTGAFYLFDREFERWWHHDIQTVAAGTAPLSLSRQEASIRDAYPDGRISRVRLPRAPDEASKWLVALPNGENREVYVDPYRGRVTGSLDPDRESMTIIRDLHGTLLAGDAGSYVVELTACWTLVMLVTGVFLWRPRKWKARGVVLPRLQAKGRRFWRDLHAIPSIFNALLVAFLILTGLPWSVFWGHQFARLGEAVPFIAPSPNFTSERPKSSAAKGLPQDRNAHAMHDAEAGKLPWVIRQSPQPSGSGPAVIGIGHIEGLLPLLRQDVFGGGVRIFYPADPDGIFMISYVPDRAEGQRTIYVDPANGQILGNIGWQDYSVAGKTTDWGVMTHMGRQYGLPNQIGGLLVCLAMIGAVTAGIILWWRRRPAGSLAAPQTKDGDRLPPALIGTVAVLAILFPLVGISLVAILGVEYLIRRRPGPQH